MAKTTTMEDAQLPTIEVDGRTFPIGPLSIYQLTKLVNLVGSGALSLRMRTAQRNAEIAQALREEQKNDLTVPATLRGKIAEKLGIAPEEVEEEQLASALEGWWRVRQQHLLMETGYDGDVGMLLDIVMALNESQITEFARIVLERDASSRLTYAWITKHFRLEWFLDALAKVVMQNHIPTIIKNLQSLSAVLSMQFQNPATPQAQNLVTSNG